jgi:hypothetical protein
MAFAVRVLRANGLADHQAGPIVRAMAVAETSDCRSNGLDRLIGYVGRTRVQTHGMFLPVFAGIALMESSEMNVSKLLLGRPSPGGFKWLYAAISCRPRLAAFRLPIEVADKRQEGGPQRVGLERVGDPNDTRR